MVAEDVENHTLRLLQEMRDSFRRVEERLGLMDQRFTDLTQRIDGNTLVFNLVAGVVYNHEERIVNLEQDKR